MLWWSLRKSDTSSLRITLHWAFPSLQSSQHRRRSIWQFGHFFSPDLHTRPAVTDSTAVSSFSSATSRQLFKHRAKKSDLKTPPKHHVDVQNFIFLDDTFLFPLTKRGSSVFWSILATSRVEVAELLRCHGWSIPILVTQKSPFRKGQMMNEPNRTEWIIQYLSSHWIFVTQGRHSYSATDTSALRDFLGCQKFMARWSPITNSPVSKLPVTHVSQWNVVLLWTTRHHSWQEVLSNFPWCWDCIQQDQYPVLFAHASHLIHKTSEKDAVLLIHLQYSTISFAFFFLTSLFHTGWPNTSDQSDSGFLRIYNLRNPPGKVTVTAARRWLGEPRSQGIFFYSPSKGVFRCKSSFWTKILIPFHWLAKRDSHTGIQSGEPTSLWPKQPPFVLVLLRCLANGL